MPIGRSQMPKQVEGQLRGARKGKNDKRRQHRIQLLEKWAKGLSNLNNYKLSCEIGVREGLGSRIILDSLQPHEHYGIDPYGNLKYQHYDNSPAYTADYTDEMKDRLQKDLEVIKTLNYLQLQILIL